MPDEGAPHTATWMAFGPSEDIWGARLLPLRARTAIAKAIAAHEPLKMLVREQDYAIASRLCGSSVELVQHPVDDLWMRDTGPVFVKNASGQLGGVSFNFNGWGNKQEHDQGRGSRAVRRGARRCAAARHAAGARRRRHRGGRRGHGDHHAQLRAQPQPQSGRQPGTVRDGAEPAAGAEEDHLVAGHRGQGHHRRAYRLLCALHGSGVVVAGPIRIRLHTTTR